jgi:hypothetical protein
MVSDDISDKMFTTVPIRLVSYIGGKVSRLIPNE